MASYIKLIILIFFLLGINEAIAAPQPALDYRQSHAFRAWFVKIIQEQIRQGPSPRWVHRDCAGLIRFGVYESLKSHDAAWLRANGIFNGSLPPEVHLRKEQTALLNRWKQIGGEAYGSFVPAIGIIQENSIFVSRDINQAQPGDLLFFDQGEDHHLMIWMGTFIAYHTGSVKPNDNGLRTLSLDGLMNWKDSRWQPRLDNPNFVGIFRLAFLSF